MSPAVGPASPIPRPALWAAAGLSAAAVVGLVLALVLVDLETASWVASLAGAVLSAATLAWSVVSLTAHGPRRKIQVYGGRLASRGNVIAPGAQPTPQYTSDDADVDVRSGPEGIASGGDIVGFDTNPTP
ncbi:hypothetical protein AB0M58_13825 [Streptomyces bobili]|uniref:hypothetical protein n=1 Tax=Streptomyces bobili TaxID=67280 RepID=UPI00342DFD55